MSSVIYAMEIRKSDLGLITMLNDGKPPKITKRGQWIRFEISEDGREVTTTIGTKREMLRDYDISGWSPLILRLKK